MGPAPFGCGCGTHLVTLGFYGYPNLMLFPTCEFARSCHIKAETRITGAPSRFPLVAALTCSGAVLHKSKPFRNIWPLHVSPFHLCIAALLLLPLHSRVSLHAVSCVPRNRSCRCSVERTATAAVRVPADALHAAEQMRPLNWHLRKRVSFGVHSPIRQPVVTA